MKYSQKTIINCEICHEKKADFRQNIMYLCQDCGIDFDLEFVSNFQHEDFGHRIIDSIENTQSIDLNSVNYKEEPYATLGLLFKTDEHHYLLAYDNKKYIYLYDKIDNSICDDSFINFNVLYAVFLKVTDNERFIEMLMHYENIDLNKLIAVDNFPHIALKIYNQYFRYNNAEDANKYLPKAA